MLILGFIVSIYWFARKSVKNEPLKSKIDNLFNSTNSFLISLKDMRTKVVLEQLRLIAKKIFIGALITCILVSLIPFRSWIKPLLNLVSAVFVISILLITSIEWIQSHKKAVKEYFFSIPLLSLIFAPSIFYLFDYYFQTNFFDEVFCIYESLNIITLQLIWSIILIVFLYLGNTLLALPTYYFLFLFIVLFAFLIRVINKHINTHILDIIVTIISISITFFKIFV